MNKPKTIADLNITWTFIKDDCGCKPCKIIPLFRKLNSSLKKILIKPKNYSFNYNNNIIKIFFENRFETQLEHLIAELNYFVFKKVQKEFILSHFERISDTEYIIHEKVLS